MTGRTLHVVGAGLAGLSAAARSVAAGWRVVVHEQSQQAGGRCRSYFDAALGRRIDNGNHVVLSGNQAVAAYLTLIGASDSLTGAADAVLPFIDRRTGERWTVRPNAGSLPWWIASPSRRVPDSRLGDYLAARALLNAPADRSVAEALDQTRPIFRRLWEPLTVAVLNTEVANASARLLGDVMRETLGRGGRASRMLVPREGLSESFVDPALAWLARAGAETRFGARLRSLTFEDGRVAALTFGGDPIILTADDAVVLAVPAPVARELIPDLVAPTEHRAILNAHYLVGDQIPADRLPEKFIGLIGGLAEWLFLRDGVLSITVSAADHAIDRDSDALARVLWDDATAVLGLSPGAPPAHRIIKEKRATFAATPAQLALRPPAKTAWSNLFLAGDWTATGLPSTIEGALRSGEAAARAAIETVSG